MLRALGITLLLGSIVLSGCGDGGPKLLPVSGIVKLDGEAKSKLLVTFMPVSGGPGAIGQTNEKGEFHLNTNGKPGAVIGEHKVVITTIKEIAETSTPAAASSAPSGSDAYMNQGRINPKDFKTPKELIPERYNTNTELVRQVASGKTSFDFDLKSK